MEQHAPILMQENTFQEICAYLDNLKGGVLNIEDVTIYNTDHESILAQLNMIAQTVKERVEMMMSAIEQEEYYEQEEEIIGEELDEGLQNLEELEEAFEEFDEEEQELDDNIEEIQEEDEEQSHNLVTNNKEKQQEIDFLLRQHDASSDGSEENDLEENKQLTPYEQKKRDLIKQIKALEDDMVKDKSWRMMGEVTAGQRGRDELLDDMPEFSLRQKQKPKMTAELNKAIDDVVKQRILDKNFDNVAIKQKKQVKELQNVDINKDERGLDQVLQNQKIGERVELTYLEKQQQQKCLEAFQLLENELRSYFINGVYTY